jgi:signal transduction histidine kinase
MEYLYPLNNEVDVLPPFRSAKDFPLKPRPERLAGLYRECRLALLDTIKARQMLRESMARKKDFIVEISQEFDRFENNLSIEAEARLELHSMNQQLLMVLAEMEIMTDGIATTVTDANKPKMRIGLMAMVEKLKALVQRWRMFKSSQLAGIAEQADRGHRDGTLP